MICLLVKKKFKFDVVDCTPVGTEDGLVWYKVAGEGHLAPGLDWASVVGLAGADFVGLDLDLEAPEAQGEGVTEITIGSMF